MTYSQVRLLVDDFSGCFRFLQERLGLECTFGGEEAGYASFKAGSAKAVVERTEHAEVVVLRAAGDGALSVLEVDDVDAEAERLGELVVGGTVSKAAWGGSVAYVVDPEGSLLELAQSRMESS